MIFLQPQEQSPPPIAARPEKTKSIVNKIISIKSKFFSFCIQYTKPIDDDNIKSSPDKLKRKQLTDEEIYGKLRLIVSHGDPNRHYKSKDKIGQG